MKTAFFTAAAFLSIGAAFFIGTAIAADFFALPRTDIRPIIIGALTSFLTLSAETLTFGTYLHKKEQQK
ncbi:hypothetical protein VVR12_03240 [Rothia sp. LK2588]|uniref:hypothetical protein n=1 Tax=Rothia sp. LK2588 TaxID=3114369 RepID=UPI0034CEF124